MTCPFQHTHDLNENLLYITGEFVFLYLPLCAFVSSYLQIPSGKKDSKAQVIIDDPRALCTMHSGIAANKTRTSMDVGRLRYVKSCVELHKVASCIKMCLVSLRRCLTRINHSCFSFSPLHYWADWKVESWWYKWVEPHDNVKSSCRSYYKTTRKCKTCLFVCQTARFIPLGFNVHVL